MGKVGLMFPILQTISLRVTKMQHTEDTEVVGLDLKPKSWVLNPICLLNASKKKNP